MADRATSCPNLIEEVTKRARGVFLWVYLVVRDLLQGLTNGDSGNLLQSQLEMFPEDLDEFFRHMVTNVPPMYLRHTARLFEIVKCASEPQSAIALSFVDEVEAKPDLAQKISVEKMDDSEMRWRFDLVRRRLDARSKGLLEITSEDGRDSYFGSKIDFLHQTVHEFLHRSESLGAIFQADSASDSPSTALVMCAASVTTLKRAPDFPTDWNIHSPIFGWVRRLDWDAESPEMIMNMLREAEVVHDHVYWINASSQDQSTVAPRFIEMACAQGVLPFVTSRKQSGENYSTSKHSALDYALQSTVLHPGIIKTLLDARGDPNAKIGHSTVFRQFMGNIARKEHPEADENIKEVLRLLLKNGADVNTTVTDPRAGPNGPLGSQNCLYGGAKWMEYKPPGRGGNQQHAWEVIQTRFQEEDLIAMSEMGKKSKSLESVGVKTTSGNWLRRARSLFP
ncbi:hypothetical protein OQA88_22 [Cercophora sp. LCS_1]